jgi:DNA (cytosine-5)-methyltransferase 1
VRFLSVCSGIEAASVAWQPLGWQAAAFAEIEPFPCAVLAHHFPEVPNLGDITKFSSWPDADFDVLVGGTPCQSFSVAGLRAGLSDPRGNLALTYLAIADRYRPRWLVWENVPGVLSSGDGRDFGSFLGGLGQLGYGFAYRVLDAQYFGLAQRRKRVFVVGHLGDWRRAAAVLFERESLRWDSPPSRGAGERAAPAIAARTSGGGGLGTDFDLDGGLIANALHASDGRHAVRRDADNIVAFGGTNTQGAIDVAAALQAHSGPVGRLDFATETFMVAGTLNSSGRAAGSATQQDAEAGLLVVPFDTTQITSRGNVSNPQDGDPCHPPAQLAHRPAIAFSWQRSASQTMPVDADVTDPLMGTSHPAIAFRSDAGRKGRAKTPSAGAEGRVRLRDPGFNVYAELAPTLDSSAPHGIGNASGVRRLTP